MHGGNIPYPTGDVTAPPYYTENGDRVEGVEWWRGHVPGDNSSLAAPSPGSAPSNPAFFPQLPGAEGGNSSSSAQEEPPAWWMGDKGQAGSPGAGAAGGGEQNGDGGGQSGGSGGNGGNAGSTGVDNGRKNTAAAAAAAAAAAGGAADPQLVKKLEDKEYDGDEESGNAAALAGSSCCGATEKGAASEKRGEGGEREERSEQLRERWGWFAASSAWLAALLPRGRIAAASSASSSNSLKGRVRVCSPRASVSQAGAHRTDVAWQTVPNLDPQLGAVWEDPEAGAVGGGGTGEAWQGRVEVVEVVEIEDLLAGEEEEKGESEGTEERDEREEREEREEEEEEKEEPSFLMSTCHTPDLSLLHVTSSPPATAAADSPATAAAAAAAAALDRKGGSSISSGRSGFGSFSAGKSARMQGGATGGDAEEGHTASQQQGAAAAAAGNGGWMVGAHAAIAGVAAAAWASVGRLSLPTSRVADADASRGWKSGEGVGGDGEGEMGVERGDEVIGVGEASNEELERLTAVDEGMEEELTAKEARAERAVRAEREESNGGEVRSAGGWTGFGSWWRGRANAKEGSKESGKGSEKGSEKSEEREEGGEKGRAEGNSDEHEKGEEGTSEGRTWSNREGVESSVEERDGLNGPEAKSECCYNEDNEQGKHEVGAGRGSSAKCTGAAAGGALRQQEVTTAVAKWAGVREMSLKEVLAMTDNFAQARILHERRSVAVYRACCPASGQVWAVKRAKLSLLSPSPTSPGGSGSGRSSEGDEEREGERGRDGTGEKVADALASAAAAAAGGGAGGAGGGGRGRGGAIAVATSPEAVVSMTADAFAEAAMALGRMAHPRLARVVAFCRECAERILVLEMAEGEALSAALHCPDPAARRVARAAAPLSLPHRLQVAADVTSALQHLHAQLQAHEPPRRKERLYSRLLLLPPRAHGAVSAENVIVDGEGRARVIGGEHLRALLVQSVGGGACAVRGEGDWERRQLEWGKEEEEEEEAEKAHNNHHQNQHQQRQRQQQRERERGRSQREVVFDTSSDGAAYADTWQQQQQQLQSASLSPCLEPHVAATVAGDVFSMGVLLLELVTGRRPVVRGQRDLRLAALAAAAAAKGAGGREEAAGAGGAGGIRGRHPREGAAEEGRESESEGGSEGVSEGESEEEETGSKLSLWSLPLDKSPLAHPASPTHQPIPTPMPLPSPSLRCSSRSSPPHHQRYPPLHIVTWVQMLLVEGDPRVIVDPELGLWAEPEISGSGRVVCREESEVSGLVSCASTSTATTAVSGAAGASTDSTFTRSTLDEGEEGESEATAASSCSRVTQSSRRSSAGSAAASKLFAWSWKSPVVTGKSGRETTAAGHVKEGAAAGAAKKGAAEQGAAAGLVSAAVEAACVAAVSGVVELALRCVLPAPAARPSMAQVATAVEMLRLDLQGELVALGAAGAAGAAGNGGEENGKAGTDEATVDPSVAQVATALEMLRMDFQGELVALGAAGCVAGGGTTGGAAACAGTAAGAAAAEGSMPGKDCRLTGDAPGDEVVFELSFKQRSPGVVDAADASPLLVAGTTAMPMLHLDSEEEEEEEDEEEGEEESDNDDDEEDTDEDGDEEEDEEDGDGDRGDSYECENSQSQSQSQSLSAAAASVTLAAVSESMSGEYGSGAAYGEDEATSGKRRGWFSARADWEGEVTSGEIEEEEDGEEVRTR
ncbi:unnamed protein product [Closterium sp. Naga37s-1]|nr:unnamed protein product [Closterium sp. Naga37s-1]